MNKQLIELALEKLKLSKHTFAFTGAGISIESGIPPFRGETGLWSKYDPIVLDINYFQSHSNDSWKVIKEIFYDFFGQAFPNDAHIALSKLEAKGFIKSIITQNIDNLHQEAGSKQIIEFHGNSHTLECLYCESKYKIEELNFEKLPVICPKCNGLVKPDFVFFGESIPPQAYEKSIEQATLAEVVLIIGTTGEITPASYIPHMAKENGAFIIEINPNPSKFTHTITDIFIQEKASSAMNSIVNGIFH